MNIFHQPYTKFNQFIVGGDNGYSIAFGGRRANADVGDRHFGIGETLANLARQSATSDAGADLLQLKANDGAPEKKASYSKS